jgi:CheY-like chemotaxis protein
VADHAVAAPPVGAGLVRGALADHAEAVGVVDVQQRVVLARQGGELGQPRRVAGHAVDAVHADQPGRAWGLPQQPRQRLRVVVGEARQAGAVGAGDGAAVVDRLVGPGVQQDGARAGQQRDDRGVDVGQGRQQQGVLGAQQLGQPDLDHGRAMTSTETPRVLVVDDAPAIRNALRGILEDAGIEVVGEAPDGARGVTMTGSLRPDVVLMDLRMPWADGFQATERIATDYPDVRVVVLSAYQSDESAAAAQAAGAFAFLPKDCATKLIRDTVLAAWRERR